MGKKGTTVIPAVIKKMGGRSTAKSGPIKKLNKKSSYGGYNK
jgi:hypothetical protein